MTREADTVTLLSFELSGRRFALTSTVVREIVRAVSMAPLPKAPPIIEGVINVRGTLVPVLDIRQRFGLPAVPLSASDHLILAAAGLRIVAIRVDQATGLVTVPEEDIDSAEARVPGAELVAGIARLPDGALVIHDLERFLSLDEGNATTAALAEAGK
ncbi:MAG TPA: chemotaxis protein CheW [Gemmatimonadales bacterium]|nr:chemotaxis protein CheW [Gemmatimonadales bacterium]